MKADSYLFEWSDYQGFVSVLGSSLAVSSGISRLFNSGDHEQTASCDLVAEGQSHQIETLGSAKLALMELDALSETRRLVF